MGVETHTPTVLDDDHPLTKPLDDSRPTHTTSRSLELRGFGMPQLLLGVAKN